jgi:hypothetical protein
MRTSERALTRAANLARNLAHNLARTPASCPPVRFAAPPATPGGNGGCRSWRRLGFGETEGRGGWGGPRRGATPRYFWIVLCLLRSFLTFGIVGGSISDAFISFSSFLHLLRSFYSDLAPVDGAVAAHVATAGVARPAMASVIPTVWWFGAHGGAGESTLERLFRGSRAAGHRWPEVEERAAVILVARSDVRGLRAAQRALRERMEHQLPVDVLGLVLMADAPGRLPRAVRELADVVAGTVPRIWVLPWVEAWRVGEIPSPANSPKEARALAVYLRALLGLEQKGRLR